MTGTHSHGTTHIGFYSVGCLHPHCQPFNPQVLTLSIEISLSASLGQLFLSLLFIHLKSGSFHALYYCLSTVRDSAQIAVLPGSHLISWALVPSSQTKETIQFLLDYVLKISFIVLDTKCSCNKG